MKSLIFTFLLLFVGFAVSASDADLFKLDYDAVQKEFAGLERVSDILADNPEMTYSMLMETNSGLVESVSLVPGSALPMGAAAPALGIPSFWWGCVLGVVGIAIVYIVSDQDADEAKKALWGCVASSVGWIAFYFLFWGALFVAGG